jgi:redox-sensitive bicupin YhaK (pirin superfamily)
MIDLNHAFVIQRAHPLPQFLDTTRVAQPRRFNTSLSSNKNRERSVSGINFHQVILDVLINSQQSLSILNSDILIDATCCKELSASSSESGLSSKRRRVTKLQRFERVPAWPLKNGIPMRILARLPGGHKVASELEERLGGMDCPNIFVNTDDISKTSPFLMLVHHNHSFDLFDPARWMEKSLIPEGFPSHAHRGMATITICLRGGLIHRDSLGIKQVFGPDENEKYQGKHTQILNFGAGVLHELMWDSAPFRVGQQRITRQEIYQIWVDVPSDQRMSKISVDLLGGDHETPTVVEKEGSEVESTTTVIAGSHKNYKSMMPQKSDYTILQVFVEPGKTWRYSSPLSFKSMVLYMRSGRAEIEGTVVPKHCTSFCSNNGKELVVVADDNLGADFLLLAGRPLCQDIIVQGSVAGESNQDIADFKKDCREHKMGKPWDENMTDAQWKMHVDSHPCKYELE